MSERSRARATILAVAWLMCAGCAAHPGADTADGAAPGITSTVITADELRNAGLLGSTAYDAIQRLRPGFLIDRTAGPRRTTQPIQVSINRGQLSPVSTLNSLPAATISEIRYLTVGEATQRFSTRASGPVILVTLQRQEPTNP